MNFDYLKELEGLETLYRYADAAERYQATEPELSALNARRALEWIAQEVLKMKRVEVTERTTIYNMVTSEAFTEFINDDRLMMAVHYIRKVGNATAHIGKTVTRRDSFFALLNLYNIIGAILLKLRIVQTLGPFDKSLIPTTPNPNPVPTREVDRSRPTKFAERISPEVVEEATKVEPALSWDGISEAETRRRFIDLMLSEAGWEVLETPGDIQPGKAAVEVKVEGMPTESGTGFADYVLFGPDRKPLAVIEAKRTSKDPKAGEHQAKLYAESLEKKYGVRPVIYLSNGFTTYVIDRLGYPKRKVAAFHTLEDLRLLVSRQGRPQITDLSVRTDIAGRYYQIAGIRALAAHFNALLRRGLLVMATGTGKTRTAIALVELMARAGWVKNTLFLADRTSLVKQAKREFAKHLPAMTLADLTSPSPDRNARILFSTYQTMINYVDSDVKPFSPGRFDLIIVDEAHRSIFDKFKAIFSYFDSLLVGLTATPRDQVNRSTYDIFELEQGAPNYAYEYETAIADKHLCPYSGLSYRSEVIENGIPYDKLTPEEREQMEKIWEWEALRNDLNPETDKQPRDIENSEIFNYVFNTTTIDAMLRELMEKGLRVESGEKLGKTIIFAMNRDHAEKIVERFNYHFPHLGDDFCRQIDYSVSHSQDLIDRFGVRGGMPQIAVSVDMLDTGIDVPDILNLVFFKRIRSRIKFWQMIGRGTRLSPDIFGPGRDKEEFYVFDWCGNFEFFNQNPHGVEATRSQSLTERLFGFRTDIARLLQAPEYREEGRWEREWGDELKTGLLAQVRSLNDSYVSVRERWETVSRFRSEEAWKSLSAVDGEEVKRAVGPLLPTSAGNESAMKFDLLALTVQLSMLDDTVSESYAKRKILAIADRLSRLSHLPQVTKKMDRIREVMTEEFWEKKTLSKLEEMRLDLPDLLQLVLEKKGEGGFDVEVSDSITSEELKDELRSTMSYRRRVLDYLADNRNNEVLWKIRNFEQLTGEDIRELERVFFEELGTPEEYRKYLEQEQVSEELPVAGLIRKMQGVDRAKAVELFTDFLASNSLTPDQEDYLESILNYISENGDIRVEQLMTEPPFDEVDEEIVFPGKFGRVGDFVRLLHRAITVA